MRISKSEITTQDHYDKKQFKAVLNTTSSKGVLPKYTDEKIWIKTDIFGYESLAEVLASRLVSALGIKTVEYRPCLLITNEYDAVSACVSDSFTSDKTEILSVGRMLERAYSCDGANELYKQFMSHSNIKDRLEFVVKGLTETLREEFVRIGIARYIWIDSLILNTDRHLYNMVIKKEGNECRFIYFDYGASLLSDLENFSIRMPLDTAMHKAKSKPFSTRFSRQLSLFENYIPSLTDTVRLRVSDLYKYYNAAHIERCLNVIKKQLKIEVV